MNLIVIGAGNIGLVTALCFAEKGRRVFCVDTDAEKIARLQDGKVTFYERDVENLLNKHLKNKQVTFTTELSQVIHEAPILFVAVGTPNLADGRIDLTSFTNVIGQIASVKSKKTIIIRSTITPQTNLKLAAEFPDLHFISSPEFIREGSAVADCFNPDRIIIGTRNSVDDLKLFQNLYENFNISTQQFVVMDPTSAEMTKYAANIFLAARVSMMNELARVCEKNGADIQQIKNGIGMDRRIGAEFLNAGLGFGGSCFPKDLEAFIHYGKSIDENLLMTAATSQTNAQQIKQFGQKIKTYFNGKSLTKNIAIWGLSFKPETDDLRHSPSLALVNDLLKDGFKLNLYDPKAAASLKIMFHGNSNIKVHDDSFATLKDCNALVISTEWSQFVSSDLQSVKKNLNHPAIFDGRNSLDPKKAKQAGLEYFSVGRPT